MAYASKYYDPVKAHEYYLKHRKLKGQSERISTKGLNDEGKNAAKYVKEQIQAEKKEYNKQLSEQLKQKIAELKESLKGASKEERAEAVAQLRQQYKEMKEKAKEAFAEKYAKEMDAIKADPKFKGGNKKKGKKGKKKSSGSGIDIMKILGRK